MKTIIAEDNPQILGFDESKFAAKLHSEEQDAELAVRILDEPPAIFGGIAELPDAAFSRTARHNDLGLITLGQSVQWNQRTSRPPYTLHRYETGPPRENR